MKLNEEVFQNVKKAGKQILVVTKYWDHDQTQEILELVKERAVFLGLGENRIKALTEKKLPREMTHFIGRMQSRQLPEIVKHTSVLHSLEKASHAKKINQINLDQELEISVFIQVNISGEVQKGGITPEEIPEFLEMMKKFKTIKVLGFSGMGSGEFGLEQKIDEFAQLVKYKDQFLPGKMTSAGTTRDYQIALDCGIDVVRMGTGILN